ncbi:MAG: hypothetical protein AB7O44_27515 [Hyphomicrobiaceae bacterium]
MTRHPQADASRRVKPLPCKAPEVRALLGGRKTQMRIPLKPQPDHCHRDIIGKPRPWTDDDWNRLIPQLGDREVKLPYAPGDLLWVREAWGYFGGSEYLYQRDPDAVGFRADHSVLSPIPGGRWRPSIHMPRWASRITLAVEVVKVERLRDISEDEAKAEGAPPFTGALQSYRTGFYHIWQSLHGPGSWEANPWVCALTFRVHRCNVDQLAEAAR